ncbi:MAG: hypothetical protein QM803_09860 [Rhodocyclaceae bacterium]
MTTLSPADLLVTRLQNYLSSGPLARSGKTAKGTQTTAGDAFGTEQAAREDTSEQLLARRIDAIEATDPDRRRKIFRAFLETTLLAEFGQHIINDPAFYSLVSKVEDTMSDDAGVQQAIDQAVELLEQLR